MGAWDESIFGNDTAMDWMGEIETPVAKTLNESKSSLFYEEWRAAAYFVVNYHFFDLYELALKRLNTILDDTDWISGWRDSSAIRTMIQGEANAIQSLIDQFEA